MFTEAKVTFIVDATPLMRALSDAHYAAEIAAAELAVLGQCGESVRELAAEVFAGEQLAADAIEQLKSEARITPAAPSFGGRGREARLRERVNARARARGKRR